MVAGVEPRQWVGKKSTIATLLDPAPYLKDERALTLSRKHSLELLSVSAVSGPHLLQRQVVILLMSGVVSARAADHASFDTQVQSSVSKPTRLKVMDDFEDTNSDGGIFTQMRSRLTKSELILCCVGESASIDIVITHLFDFSTQTTAATFGASITHTATDFSPPLALSSHQFHSKLNRLI